MPLLRSLHLDQVRSPIIRLEKSTAGLDRVSSTSVAPVSSSGLMYPTTTTLLVCNCGSTLPVSLMMNSHQLQGRDPYVL